MKEATVNKFLAEALAIEDEAAQEAGAVAYMARALVQATMPHRKTTENVFVRQNGDFTLSLMAPPQIGLPYGSLPRLIMAYLTTEAVRTKSKEIELGATMTDFLAKLKEVPTGGKWGSITRVREQTKRLFSSSITCSYTNDHRDSGLNLVIADSYDLWWSPKDPDQNSLFRSHIVLGNRFFEEVTQRPVPIDLRALMALKKSPMALDIYCWLTYRMSYVRKETVIPWIALQAQFGAEYGRVRDFKRKYLEQLKSVSAVYPDAKLDALDNGLLLKPSPTHISRN